jgi:hypothetical protein
MAARLNPFNQQEVKNRIQATQLVKRVQDHALGLIDMTATQIDCAKFLLNKRLSNAATEVNVGGQDGNPIVNRVEFVIVDPKD